VSWCATCDGFFFRGQDIVVVGGGDSAVEEATFLTKFAASVTIVHRRDELRASKIMAARAMADPKIRFAWNSAVEAIHGKDKVTGVTLRDTFTGATRLLPASGVFVAIGHDPRNELIKGVVDLDDHGYVKDMGRSTATNIPGVFAAGDLVDRPTGRRSPPQARAAPQHWTPSAPPRPRTRSERRRSRERSRPARRALNA